MIRFDGTEVAVNPLNDSIVVHDEITAVKQLERMQNSILIAPNPATNFTDIILGKAQTMASELTICNAFGDVILKRKIQNEIIITISTENFASGIYFVKVKTTDGNLIKKLAITK